ncbi:MAG: hypothetical protein TECD_00570 [Hyphomicrobiaceae bacterium hypho_1]
MCSRLKYCFGVKLQDFQIQVLSKRTITKTGLLHKSMTRSIIILKSSFKCIARNIKLKGNTKSSSLSKITMNF